MCERDSLDEKSDAEPDPKRSVVLDLASYTPNNGASYEIRKPQEGDFGNFISQNFVGVVLSKAEFVRRGRPMELVVEF
jgi:hypothetical protein